MGFPSGSVSFRRFFVDFPGDTADSILQQARNNRLISSTLGLPEEVEYGWVGAKHMFDGEITREDTVFADAIHLGLRIDTNKVPSNIRKAYQRIEEDALAKTNPSGFISKIQKREAKETTKKMVEQDMREGKFRRSKVIPVLWDIPHSVLYAPVSGSSLEKLAEIAERTWKASISPCSAGTLANRYAAKAGLMPAYEDLRPTRFVMGPDGEAQRPEYPWVAKGPEPKDFLGNEFLLWLWHHTEVSTGIFKTLSGDITVFFDYSLDLECAYGQTGKESLKGDDMNRSPEAKSGLLTGKIPRKAGITFDFQKQQYSFILTAETMRFNSMKIPDVEEAESPRVLFEERVSLINDFCTGFDAMFNHFLARRLSTSDWARCTDEISRWIQKGK